jgi:hypothetical protein
VNVPLHYRLVGVVLLVTVTALSALLPPAHIHLAIAHHDDDHGHAVALEHAHWSAHGTPRAAFDDDDGRTIFVDHSALTSSVDTTFARPAAVVLALLTLPAPATFTVAERQTSGNSPRDGPSRGIRLLRAPPAFDTL